MRGNMPGAEWPPVFGSKSGPLGALTLALDTSQWLPADILAARQDDQLALISSHFAEHSEPFRQRLAASGLPQEPLDLAGLRAIAPLTRRDLQSWGERLYCAAVPPVHGDTYEVKSSGSTGEPVEVRRTGLCQLFWQAMNVRHNLWHEPHGFGRFAAVRRIEQDEARLDNWGWPMSALFDTGPLIALDNGLDPGVLVDKLRAFAPDTLLIYPNSLEALLDKLAQEGVALPTLKGVRTVAETLSGFIRDRAERELNVPVRDCYSSMEVGYIAIECPAGGLYHIMSEALIVEIVNDAGEPCTEGEIGRLLVTDLHNHAMPMIRYEISDHAEVGPACACGRGLPTLRRIAGRSRNMVMRPGGSSAWPRIGDRLIRDVAPVAQYQLVQHDLETIEVRLVAETPLSPDQELALVALVQDKLEHPFSVRFTYFEGRLPTRPNGKFEEFMRLF